jgi:hypothetical protein
MPNEQEPGATPPRGPQPGSPRVQSWIRTVLNPLIEAVEYELPLLERGSLTWRFIDRKPERLNPIPAYVNDSRRALEDLLRARPHMKPPLEEHDKRLKIAVARAGDAHDSILAKPEFVALVEARLADYEKSHSPAMRPSGAFAPDKLPGLVADRVVNNDGEVRYPYTDAEFWNLNRVAFMEAAYSRAIETLRAAVRDFAEFDVDLLSKLKDWHFALVEEFDVEPV